MELGNQIRQQRQQKRISQEDLSQAIFVSRQTISNWETDKTYPDVQSLLLMSNFFGVSVDSLIKGDVEAMEKAIKEDVLKMKRLSWVVVVTLILALVMLLGGFLAWGWGLVPSSIIFFLLWGVSVAATVTIERIKKKHDLVTYREIVAFQKGEAIDRITQRSHWSQGHRTLKIVLETIAGAVVGGVLGVLVYQFMG